MKKILITGAYGLVGTDLVLALRKKYKRNDIVTLSHKTIHNQFDVTAEKGDVRDGTTEYSVHIFYGAIEKKYTCFLKKDTRLPWGWNHRYNLKKMTKVMLTQLKVKLRK